MKKTRAPIRVFLDEELAAGEVEAIDAFLQWLDIQKGASAATRRAYGTDLRQFAQFLSRRGCALADPGSIGRRDVESFVAELFRAGEAKSSLARKLAAVRTLFRFWVRTGLLEDNSAARVPNPRQEQHAPRLLNVDETTVMDGILAEEEIEVGQYVIVFELPDAGQDKLIILPEYPFNIAGRIPGQVVKGALRRGVEGGQNEIIGIILGGCLTAGHGAAGQYAHLYALEYLQPPSVLLRQVLHSPVVGLRGLTGPVDRIGIVRVIMVGDGNTGQTAADGRLSLGLHRRFGICGKNGMHMHIVRSEHGFELSSQRRQRPL